MKENKDLDMDLEHPNQRRLIRILKFTAEVLLPVFTLFFAFSDNLADRIRFPLIFILVLLLLLHLVIKMCGCYETGIILLLFDLLSVLIGILKLWNYPDGTVTDLANPWICIIFVLVSAVISILVFFLVFGGAGGFKNFALAVLMAVTAGFVLYQSAVSFNAIYDTSVPKYKTAKVLEKSVKKQSRGGIRYYVRLAFEELEIKKKNIVYSCNYKLYERIAEGENVQVSFHDGLLGMPWCRIEKILQKAGAKAPDDEDVIENREKGD